MRHLGIDYGSKRIGLAISDESATLAFPHDMVQSGPKAVAMIAEICAANKIKTVVLGESRNYKGEENKIMEAAKPFAEELRSKGFEVIFEPEVLSTMQAERIQGRRSDIDASAAAIILQSYLDRKAFAKK